MASSTTVGLKMVQAPAFAASSSRAVSHQQDICHMPHPNIAYPYRLGLGVLEQPPDDIHSQVSTYLASICGASEIQLSQVPSGGPTPY